MSVIRHPSRAQFCKLSTDQRERLIKGEIVDVDGKPFAIDWIYAVRQWAYEHDYVGTSGGWIWGQGSRPVCQGWRNFLKYHRADVVAMYRALSAAADRGAQ